MRQWARLGLVARQISNLREGLAIKSTEKISAFITGEGEI
jgi:hypothetical protein